MLRGTLSSLRNFFALRDPIKSVKTPSKKHPQSPEKRFVNAVVKVLQSIVRGIEDIFWQANEQVKIKLGEAKKFRNDAILKAIILFFIFHLSFFIASAQDTSFARATMDTLCSPYFAGRGYVDKGAEKASEYISADFKKYKLERFHGESGYFQKFDMSVNTFPDKLFFSVDRKELKPGQDYLVDPSSPGISRQPFKLYYVNDSFIQNFDKIKVRMAMQPFALVIDEAFLKDRKDKEDIKDKLSATNPGAYIYLHDKLIWDASQKVGAVPVLWAKKANFPAHAKGIILEIENEFFPKYPMRNVVGYVKGKKYPDSFFVFSAHYDHLGKMGADAYFPGANDNASGVAMLLDMMHYYSKPENQPDYSIAFIAFTGEEAGLVGSTHYTNDPLFPLNKISFLINLDLEANGQDGMMVINGAVFTHDYDRLDSLNNAHNYLKEIKKRGKAANSDHYPFYEKGIRCFYVFLMGEYPYYHDIYDTPEKPTLKGYLGAFHLLTDFVGELTTDTHR